MRRIYVILAAISIAGVPLFLTTAGTAGKNDKFIRSAAAIPDRYIVVLNDNTNNLTEDVVLTKAGELVSAYGGKPDKVYSSAIKGYSVQMTAAEAETLSQDPRVKYVEEDGEVSASTTELDPAWALDRIDQHTLPFDNAYNYSGVGTGVNVYVIDSGILTTHVEFQGRAFDAYDAVHDNTPISECNGHGTGVAGVIGSYTYGVAKNVTLNSVRVLPCTGYGTVSDVISGVDWVTRHSIKPAVANMSLETGLSKSMNDAVSASVSSGVSYVVAAGNDTDDACRYSPSSLLSAITVGSTNSADERVYYSNFGSCVDLFAPGEGVKTIWNTTDTTVTYASGTSFASPYVAGAAALYLEANPLASPQEVQSAIVSGATPAVLNNVGTGSPNLMLFSPYSSTVNACSGTDYTGTIAVSGGNDYQSGVGGFAGGTGTYSGTLSALTPTQFTLFLEKGKGTRWSTVASSSSTDVQPTIKYSGKSGNYRWRIAAVTGGGNYALCAQTP